MSTQAPLGADTRNDEPGGYYWARARKGALPLVLGALGLAGLGVGQLAPIRHQVEQDLRIRSLEALGGAGLSGVNVAFTGQDGVLTGAVSSAADVERALQIVRGLDGVRVARSELTVPGSDGPAGGQPGGGGDSPTASASPAGTAGAAGTPAATGASPGPTTAAPSVAATPPAPTASTPGSTPGASSSAAATVQEQLRALAPINFAFDRSALNPAGRKSVARAAAILKASPDLTIRVEGFTDDVGSRAYNLRLGKARAAKVRKALVANGVDPSRVTIVGVGEDRPKVPNTSAKKRAKNRRAEIVVGG